MPFIPLGYIKIYYTYGQKQQCTNYTIILSDNKNSNFIQSNNKNIISVNINSTLINK
jgi:hypothetical protein